MIYLARLIHVLGAGVALSMLLALILLLGRPGADPLLDAPDMVPWAFAVLILGVGLAMVGGALGSDLPPFDRRRTRLAAPAPAAPAAPAGNPEDARIVTRFIRGEGDVTRAEFSAAWDRWEADKEAAMTPDERDRRDRIAALRTDAAPCRLDLMVPPVPSDSWVGGCPSLPDDVAWPDRDGKPLHFFAQIAAHHLPEDVWGGLGPRSGWLILFGRHDAHGDAVVLHTHELGRPRALPYGLAYDSGLWEDHADQARQMLGNAGVQPPRWPVRVVPDDTPARPSGGGLARRVKALVDLSDPASRPFDWETLIALLDAVIATAERLQTPKFDHAGPKAAGYEAQIASVEAVLPQVRDLSDAVRSQSATTAFDRAMAAQVVQVLAAITVQTVGYKNGAYVGIVPAKLLHLRHQPDYARMFELRARHLYTADPASIPDEVRANLEPLWQEAAADEVITLGGDAERFEAGGNAILLELVPSPLLGWTFGDHSNFACLIRDADLYDGDLNKARWVDNHGI